MICCEYLHTGYVGKVNVYFTTSLGSSFTELGRNWGASALGVLSENFF